MPLFFAVSGGAVLFSLNPGEARPFVKARITRLLIPLVLVGTFLINPLYIYAIRLFSGQAGGGFFHWYPKFFEGVWGFGGNFAPLGQGTHLWYLEYLFIFSLILLPFFLRSKKRIAGGLKRLSNRFEKPWALFLIFLPISAAGAGFELIGLGAIRIAGGWDPISYLLFFSYGYMIFFQRPNSGDSSPVRPNILGGSGYPDRFPPVVYSFEMNTTSELVVSRTPLNGGLRPEIQNARSRTMRLFYLKIHHFHDSLAFHKTSAVDYRVPGMYRSA
jgi:hypothetical protein